MSDRLSFNPTMVRFKADDSTSEPQQVTDVSIPQWFDSKTLASRVFASTRFCFNPTMVRFKGNSASVSRAPRFWFQSHNGSIQSSLTGVIVPPIPQFQSHNGSIQRRAISNKPRVRFHVSIPQWFDSKPPKKPIKLALFEGQNLVNLQSRINISAPDKNDTT